MAEISTFLVLQFASLPSSFSSRILHIKRLNSYACRRYADCACIVFWIDRFIVFGMQRFFRRIVLVIQ